MSYMRVKAHALLDGNRIRMGVELPGGHSQVQAFGAGMGVAADRIFASTWTWRRDTGSDIEVGVGELAEFKENRSIVTGLEVTLEAARAAASAVRGGAVGYYRLHALAANVCRVTVCFRAQVRGQVPKLIIDMRVKNTLGVVELVRDLYERNGKVVDRELVDAAPRPPTIDELDDDQRGVIARCRVIATTGADANWVKLKSANAFVDLAFQQTELQRGRFVLGRAEAVIDSPALTCAAGYYHKFSSRQGMAKSREEGDPARLVVKENSKLDQTWALVKALPLLLANREFISRQIMFSDTNSDIVIVFEPPQEEVNVDYGANLKLVRGMTAGIVVFSPLPGDEQCKMTLYQVGDAGGYVPQRIFAGRMHAQLRSVATTQEEYQRHDEIDDAAIRATAALMRPSRAGTTDQVEDAVVDRVRDQLDSIPDSSFEKFESPDPFVRMEGYFAGGKHGTNRASTVLDEDICACAASTYPMDLRQDVKEFFADGGVERAMMAHSEHSYVGQLLRDFNIPTLSPREFVARCVWRWESETVLLVAIESCLDDQYPSRPGIVRASVITLRKFERLNPLGEIPQTRFTWTQQPDMGGLIPSRAVRGAAVGQMMYVRRSEA
jgi:hypothetical protein